MSSSSSAFAWSSTRSRREYWNFLGGASLNGPVWFLWTPNLSVPLSLVAINLPSLVWTVVALLPREEGSGDELVLLDSETSSEVLDLVALDLWGLVWLSNSVPLSEGNMASNLSSLS